MIGRKNYYGSKSRRGTEVAAVFHTLIESAKFAGVEPAAYLEHAARLALEGGEPPLPHELARVAPSRPHERYASSTVVVKGAGSPTPAVDR